MGSSASRPSSANISCSCHCSHGKERFEVEDDAATRQDTSGYLKRKDKEHPTSTVPTISRAAKEAAELHATRSMSCVGPMDEKEPCQEPDQEPQRTPGEPLRLPLGAFGRHMRTPLDAEDTNMEPFSSDGSSLESGSPKTNRSQRSPKRRGWKRLSICETMPVSPSSALQIIINNPGKLENFYTLDQGKPLGKGSFGVVKRAYVLATQAQRAAKFIAIERMKEKLNVLKQEIEIMKAVDHPNIIMLYEIFEDDEFLCLVMEICTGGTLLNRIRSWGRFTEEQTAVALLQVLRAVFYLHRNFICHRDLKAENILISTPDVLTKTLLKVSDFGLSCTFRPRAVMTDKVGTLTHMSPEVLNRKYTNSCDVWACGIIMYNLMSGTVPFASEEEIKSGRIAFSSRWCDASQEAVLFTKRLLGKPVHRPPAERALQDVFFQKHLPEPEDPPLRFSLLDDLRTFRKQNKLKRASLTTIASLLADEHVKAARDIFISMDIDGDGTLCVAEMEKRLRKMKEEGKMDKDMRRKDVERVFRDFDSASGSLKDFTYTEFLAATFDRKTCLTEAVCREAFNTLDKNGDGTVDLGELHSGRLLGHIDMAELKETLEDLDENGDSVLDFPEYMEMLRSIDSKVVKTPKVVGETPDFGI